MGFQLGLKLVGGIALPLGCIMVGGDFKSVPFGYATGGWSAVSDTECTRNGYILSIKWIGGIW